MITANVIYRVFRLKVGLETGTAFTIEEGGGGSTSSPRVISPIRYKGNAKSRYSETAAGLRCK